MNTLRKESSQRQSVYNKASLLIELLEPSFLTFSLLIEHVSAKVEPMSQAEVVIAQMEGFKMDDQKPDIDWSLTRSNKVADVSVSELIEKSSLIRLLECIPVPLNILFRLTIPKAANESSKFSTFPYYFVPFVISIVYVGVFTYLIVWMVVIISKANLFHANFVLKKAAISI
jgi:hypothetical protein